MSKDLLNHFDEIIQSLDAFVYHYSFAEAIARNSFGDRELLLNDFMHYCIAKSVKHLKASYLLVNSGFGEDSMVLIRSAYESYITLCGAIEAPDMVVDSFVHDKIALKAKRAKYASTKKGKTDHRKIIHKDSGKVSSAPPTIEKVMATVGNPLDQRVHREIYDFLSEHAHVHMMASGNYRDGAKYITNSDLQTINAIMFGVYFSLLILERCIYIQDVEPEERKICEDVMLEASAQLYDFISSLEFSGDVQGKLLARLDQLDDDMSFER